MIELWTPIGNNWQIKLDIRIEGLKADVARYRRELVNLRGDLSVQQFRARTLRNTLDTLVNDCVVVLATEFREVKCLYSVAKKEISYTEEKIRAITERVDEVLAEIEKLKDKRDKAETKILEFKPRD